MKLLKILLLTLLVVGVLSATAVAASLVVRHDGGGSPAARTAAPSPTTGLPSTSESAAPTQAVAPPTSTPPEDVLQPGDQGEQVRELQFRLFQLAWWSETTTGKYDAATKTAVAGFQAKRGLKATGTVDAQTWARLLKMTQTPTHDQLYNVLKPGPAILASGSDGDDVRALQARLKQIDWYFGDVTGVYDAATVEAIKGFQGKRGIPVTGDVDQRTLDRLAAMTTTPTDAEKHNREPSPGALDARCLTGRVLCIDKTSQTLRWVIDGHVLQTLDARFGSTISNTPTREGEFHVYLKDADHVSQMFGSSMPYSMFFSGGQAVHYSSDFAAVGYAGASHGCVNIRDYDGIAWLFGQVQVGDKVVVYWS
jgi:peptidoglycan hydrolase-like protein with peptidoglycan-binding domain